MRIYSIKVGNSCILYLTDKVEQIANYNIVTNTLYFNRSDFNIESFFENVLQPTLEEITMFNLEFGDEIFEKMMRGESLN